MQITGPKTRQAVLVTDSPYDPEVVPERLALFKADGTPLDSSSVVEPPAIARTNLLLLPGIEVLAGFTGQAVKLASGEVMAEGILKNNTGGTLGADSFFARLPVAAMYPTGNNRPFFCGCSDGVMRRFDAQPDGFIKMITAGLTQGSWVSLTAIRFLP